MSKVNWRELFEATRGWIFQAAPGKPIDDDRISIGSLECIYLAFKARMQEELVADKPPKADAEIAGEADMSLAFFEGQADTWAARINLNSMVENIVSPMRLSRCAPDNVREKSTKRMKVQIDALIRQAFIEGEVGAIEGTRCQSKPNPIPRDGVAVTIRWKQARAMTDIPR